jgi:hypothetical protein
LQILRPVLVITSARSAPQRRLSGSGRLQHGFGHSGERYTFWEIRGADVMTLVINI